MQISSELLKQDLDRLTSDQLEQVAEFIAFLKFRAKRDRRAMLVPQSTYDASDGI